jgi:hypothetical protein
VILSRRDPSVADSQITSHLHNPSDTPTEAERHRGDGWGSVARLCFGRDEQARLGLLGVVLVVGWG